MRRKAAAMAGAHASSWRRAPVLFSAHAIYTHERCCCCYRTRTDEERWRSRLQPYLCALRPCMAARSAAAFTGIAPVSNIGRPTPSHIILAYSWGRYVFTDKTYRIRMSHPQGASCCHGSQAFQGWQITRNPSNLFHRWLNQHMTRTRSYLLLSDILQLCISLLA